LACTHPVLYNRGKDLVCHICGAVIKAEAKEEPPRKRKPAAKSS